MRVAESVTVFNGLRVDKTNIELQVRETWWNLDLNRLNVASDLHQRVIVERQSLLLDIQIENLQNLEHQQGALLLEAQI